MTLRLFVTVAAGATFVTSCAGAPAGGMSALVVLIALTLLSCRAKTDPLEPIAPADGGEGWVAPPDFGQGTWERCCRGDRVTTCFCPAGLSCNYGWFTDCGGGRCALGSDAGPACAPDGAGAEDLSGPDLGSGRWEPCCRGGTISTCFCPAGAVCNYGRFTDCGDGTCVNPGDEDMCSSSDAGARDAAR